MGGGGISIIQLFISSVKGDRQKLEGTLSSFSSILNITYSHATENHR